MPDSHAQMRGQPRRIALLVPSLEVGGSERNIVLLGEVLAEVGFAIEIWLTGSDTRSLHTALEVIAIDTGAAPGRGAAIARRVRGIRANIGRFRPDCLISFLESSNIPALLAGMLSQVPVIVSVRGNPQRFNWFYRLMAFLIYRRARAVVLPSREVAGYFAAKYLLGNVVCIPNIHGVADHAMVPQRKITGPLLAVGRLVSGKRFEDAIALAELLAQGREMIVVGDGPERAALESRAARSALRVRFTGSVPHAEVLQMLEHASVLLSMSVSECWPNTIAEALASGTPVVARDCDFGPREMICDGANGFLIKAPGDLAARPEIRRALADAQAYALLCENARSSAAHWSRENIRSLWIAALGGAGA